MAEGEEEKLNMFCGTCPDSHCGKLLYFMPQVTSEVECTSCGQKHSPKALLNVQVTDDPNVVVGSLLKSILFSNTSTKKGTELVKVRGLSNFHCKLVSPLLTTYGMDKKSGKAKLLSELGQSEVFNCSVFGNRAFLIEKEHLDTPGYGRDNTGSSGYLQDTLGMIESANDENCLVPLHSDGDGHCLVHAISRAVVGRELLWHSLRQNLKDHLQQENMKYQALFRDFIDINEWDEIIAEADPEYYPKNNEPFGLRNIHVFGLANVLRRPIILLDSLEGMQSSGDYSGVFLPVLVSIEDCKSQGVLNKPLAIAWSSSARNHYVPLAGIKDSALPKIPTSLLPKAWGIPNEMVSKYIAFDENGCCTIGGSRSLPESYVQRLVAAMDDVFFEKYHVSPKLVADVNQFVFKPSNAVGISIMEIIEFTEKAVESESLFRCLSCSTVKEVNEVLPRSWREPGGRLYVRAKEKEDTGLLTDAMYFFTEAEGVPFMYHAGLDMLRPVTVKAMECDLCKGVIREVSADGTVRYMNGDRTSTTSTSDGQHCTCGFKHFWNGNEYDNNPKEIDISLEWNGKKIEEQVFWFDCESDPSLNSNVYELATGVVQKHFPGEFGSELLVRKVVDKILLRTELKKNDEAPALVPDIAMHTDSEAASTPSKIILTGPKKKTLHKEELVMSQEERLTKARITHRAAYTPKRKSARDYPERPNGNTKHGKQEAQKTNKDTTKPNTTNTTKPPTAAVSGQTKPRALKLRLSSSNGRTATITLQPSSTYAHLQEAIQAELGIPNDRQKIRYGFPPRELKPPEDEHAVLPLTYGDRVSVDELPEVKAQSEERSASEPGAEPMDVEPEKTTESGSASDVFEDDADRKKLASNLLSLLQGALNVDKWESLQHQPEQFARGGIIYNQVVSNLGPLKDNMHFSISGLPGKTFAYNADEDRLEICLGQKHIPVQPLDPETSSQDNNRMGDIAPLKRPVSGEEREGLGAFSGAVRHRDASEGRAAFSGTGRTLGGSSKTGDEEEKEENSSAMKTEVPEEAITHVQSKSQDSTVSGMIVDRLVKEGEQGMQMDSRSEFELADPSASTDIEMSAVDQNLAHEVSKSAHEMSSNDHIVGSLEHGVSEMSDIDPMVDDGKNETEDGGHEVTLEHEAEHDIVNAVHGSSVTETNEVAIPEIVGNEFRSVEHANTQHETTEITHDSNLATQLKFTILTL